MLTKFGILSIKEVQNLKKISKHLLQFDSDLSLYLEKKFYVPLKRKSAAYKPKIQLDFGDFCEL